MNSDFTQAAAAVISLVFALVSALLLPWLRSRLGAERFAEAMQWASVAVSAAEQIYKGPGRGQEKKQYVLRMLAQRGIRLDGEALEALVESEVGKLRLKI